MIFSYLIVIPSLLVIIVVLINIAPFLKWKKWSAFQGREYYDLIKKYKNFPNKKILREVQLNILINQDLKPIAEMVGLKAIPIEVLDDFITVSNDDLETYITDNKIFRKFEANKKYDGIFFKEIPGEGYEIGFRERGKDSIVLRTKELGSAVSALSNQLISIVPKYRKSKFRIVNVIQRFD